MKDTRYKIKIEPSEYYDSPDDWGDDKRFLIYDHRYFTIERKGYDPGEIFEFWSDNNETRILYNGFYVFPVFAYINVGVSLSLSRSGWPFSCLWDTSFKGFALIKREKGTWTFDRARKAAKALIEVWNKYLSGDIWSYSIIDPYGDVIDSCSAFYDKDQCIEEAKVFIEDYEPEKLVS